MKFEQAVLVWLAIILEERFGHCFRVTQAEQTLLLRLPSTSGAIVFDSLKPAFRQSRSDIPCGEWNAKAEGWNPPLGKPIPAPVASELPRPLIEEAGDYITIHYDVLGLTYWMLSRLEEVGRSDLDDHGRFPATSSHAFIHGYLERPIVDEWLDIVGQAIKRLWPGIQLRSRRFTMKISHDVDGPSRYGFQNIRGVLQAMAGDVIQRRDLKSALLAPWLRLNTRGKLHSLDPANTFDWIMDLSERHDLPSAFYFICGRTDPSKDAHYEPEHPAIRRLMRSIHERGHEIGLHPSYNTYRTPQAIQQEAGRLKKICAEEGIQQSGWGGRMHYLRWEHPITMRAWNDAGMEYDSSLGYADRPGFRCGTSFEYPAFDPICGEMLRLRIRPLIAMDCTVIAPRYMGLGVGEAALAKFQQLKNSCRMVGGNFSLLWHNTELWNDAQRRLYGAILET